jgi:hypothetical protein
LGYSAAQIVDLLRQNGGTSIAALRDWVLTTRGGSSPCGAAQFLLLLDVGAEMERRVGSALRTIAELAADSSALRAEGPRLSSVLQASLLGRPQ